MKINNSYEYLLNDLTILNGVGKKTAETLKKKKINTLFDLLWKLPKSYTDRSEVSKINEIRLNLALFQENQYFQEFTEKLIFLLSTVVKVEAKKQNSISSDLSFYYENHFSSKFSESQKTYPFRQTPGMI